MARIAVITTGLTGILHASFELISRLQTLGHEVVYLCPQDIEDRLKGLGITYVQIPEIQFEIHGKNAFKKARKQIEHTENLLKTLEIETALIDEELHELIFTALKLNIEVRLLSQFFCHQKRPNLPPLRSSLIPGKPLGYRYWQIELNWLFVKSKIFTRALLNRLQGKSYRRILILKLAREAGLRRGALTYRNFPSPFIHTALPVYSITLAELEFPHKSPANLHYIGPMVDSSRAISQADKNEEFWTDLDLKESEKKLIYCSVSTLNEGDLSFIRKVIEAVNKEPNWILIISLGGKIETSEFKEVPENVRILSWVPQLEVLKKADCSINHGGIHTINECLHFKVPMLVYSGKKYDQDGNAARINYHGIGLRGDKDKDSVDLIQNNIKTILTSDSFKEKLEMFHNFYSAYIEKDLSSMLEDNSQN